MPKTILDWFRKINKQAAQMFPGPMLGSWDIGQPYFYNPITGTGFDTRTMDTAGSPAKPKPVQPATPIKPPLPGRAATLMPATGGSATGYGSLPGRPGQLLPPTGGGGLQIEIDSTGQYWRYAVPGAGWFPITSESMLTEYGGGGGGSDLYWDPTYGSYRDQEGDFVTYEGEPALYNSMNQPAGTPVAAPGAPGAPKSPRPSSVAGVTKSVQPRTAAENAGSIASLEQSIANFRMRGKQGSYERARRERQLALMKRRLQLLKKRAGTGEGVGISPTAIAALGKWNP